MASEDKVCQCCKQNFSIHDADFVFYEKIRVPPPTFCPECRLQRRLAWRNERSLYRHECSKCKKSLISVFPKDSSLTIFCRPCWWGDDWDGQAYGIDFNPNKSFLTQWRELLQRVPLSNLFGIYQTLENSEYTNMVSYLKNCYMLTHSDYSENCSYGSMTNSSRDSVDNFLLSEGELCCETVNCRKCFQTLFSVDCESCHNVRFCRNCVGCSDCVGCVNLRNKKYHIFNQPYTKEEYERLAKEYALDSSAKIAGIKEKVYAFWQKFPQKYMHERHNVNVSGDYIYDSKNVHDTFIGADMEDCRYCSYITPPRVTNCYDFTHYGNSADLIYETLQSGAQSSRIRCCWYTGTNGYNAEYSAFCFGCNNIFGCVSLKKREYCILNKQYTKDEYEKLRAQIIEQMNANPYRDKLGNEHRYGEFFPIELSPFGYNATTAQEFFPLTEQEARGKGYHWKEAERYAYEITVPPEQIPDRAQDITDSMTNEVFGCEHNRTCGEGCTSAFRVTDDELAFYKKLRLPLPRLCPNCRHHARLKFRNPMRLWRRQCMCGDGKSENLSTDSTGSPQAGSRSIYTNIAAHFHGNAPCPNTFETSYAPEREEMVYCEQCYNAEVA